MWEMKIYYLWVKEQEITYMKYVNGRLTGLVTLCVETTTCYWRKRKAWIKVAVRRRTRSRKLLHDLKRKERILSSEGESLDSTMWRVIFGRGFGNIVRQSNKWMNSTTYHSHRYKRICYIECVCFVVV
jgi:hypothetical protein